MLLARNNHICVTSPFNRPVDRRENLLLWNINAQMVRIEVHLAAVMTGQYWRVKVCVVISMPRVIILSMA